jgi:electron transport complex protein RnfC
MIHAMGRFLKGIKLPATRATPTSLELGLPQRVILPLSQHLGAAARPTVSVGDQVRVGQLIGAPDTGGSLPVHASIAGTVVDMGEQLDHRGTTVPAVTIEADGTDRWVEQKAAPQEIASLSPDEIIQRIEQAGVVLKGMHPIALASDLVPPDQPKTHLALTGREVVRRLDTLLIAALDPEPLLMVNRYLATTHPEELVAGIAALKTATGAPRIVFAVDRSSPPCPELLAGDEEETAVVSLDGRRFPVGLTVPLLKAALGRELPLPFGHPRDVGAAVYDLDTALSVARSLRQVPPVETRITVGGGALPRSGIATVRIGTPLGTLIDLLGGFTGDPAKLIAGGPLLGVAQYELGVPITKEIPGVFALTGDEIQLVGAYRECINCGRCVMVCPVNLVPGVLSLYCARDRFTLAEQQGLLSCIECGCCDYVCPSRRPLVHLFRHAKQQLMEGER